MSSRKLSDKEFDRYARNILKKPETVPFDKGAWSAMEQQLAQGGTSSSIFGLRLLIPIGIILLTFTGYLVYQGVRAPEDISKQEVAENQQAPLEELLVIENDSNLHKSAEQSQIAEASVSKEKLTLSSFDQGTNISTSLSESQSTSNSKEISNQESNETSPESKNVQAESVSTLDKKKSTYSNSDKPSKDTVTKTNNATVQNSKEPFSTNRPNKTIVLLEEENDNTVDSLEIQSKRVTVTLAETEEYNPDLQWKNLMSKENSSDSINLDHSDAFFSRWSVGLVIAPDFTTVGQLNEFTQPGIDVGVTVEYSVNQRLSITAGAILTRKLYNTSDIGEYNVPDGFWSASWVPEEIFANCKVIDIPIDLRYRLIEGKRTSLFASAGVSSYLMLNERYDYDYGSWQNNGRQPEATVVSNENNHFFGVYNLSAIISRKIRQNISIEVEPFLKNSLGGVGWGQVKLKSTGMLLHVKYHF